MQCTRVAVIYGWGVLWLQITAGQGPQECGWVVAKVYKQMLREACQFSLRAETIESLAFDKALRKQDLLEPDSYLSILIRVEGDNVDTFAKRWVGSVKWQGQSPYRPKHKRINWFVGVNIVSIPETSGIDLTRLHREVTFEFMRASGPGGQHVNKTNSAVRLTHKPSGIQVKVDSDRSQHRNRQLAMERLQILLSTGVENDEKTIERTRWLNHYQVGRGNPVRVFNGPEFIEINK